MTAKVLPLRSRAAYDPQVGDEVICTRDGKRGFVEKVMDNKIGRPALAAVRVCGGFGVRLLSFADFRRAPHRQGGTA
mgnify:FL=1